MWGRALAAAACEKQKLQGQHWLPGCQGRRARRHVPFAAAAAATASKKPVKTDSYAEKLAVVPVWLLLDHNGRTITVVQEDGSQSTCLIFMDETTANDFLEQMKQELKQPSPANKSSSAPKQARLLQLSLREIYMFEKVPGVSYKFVPDQREVDAALKLYADNNDPLESFMGVPVFQAEDLSIPLVEKDANGKDVETVYEPLFFSKADVDGALRDAHALQQDDQVQGYLAKADKCKARYEEEADKFAKLADPGQKAKQAARKKLEKAQADEAQWRGKARQVLEADLPQIEVASLEDILSAMKARSTPEWQNALFVPPGAYDKMKSHVDESEDTKSKERSNKLKSQADALDDTKGKKRK